MKQILVTVAKITTVISVCWQKLVGMCAEVGVPTAWL